MVNKLNLNWPEFLEKYWQKKPVVLKNAFPDFADPITPDELAGLAMEPDFGVNPALAFLFLACLFIH